jgi:hypothetical protein
MTRTSGLISQTVSFEVAYKHTMKTIYTNTVAEAKRKLVNKVLDRAPPDIDSSEITLPRLTRTTLSQVRSLYCKELKSYQVMIGSSPNDLCPICRHASHTTKHLFQCPDAPTNLNLLSLWNNPHGTAYFLQSLSSFIYLSLNPLLPCPPSEPPPVARAPCISLLLLRTDEPWQTKQPTNNPPARKLADALDTI